jgi:uncharacterized protein (TIGR04141 family)
LIEIRAGARKLGDLYVQQPRSRIPGWADLFDGYMDVADLGRVSSAAAVFIVKVQGRMFAIVFGHGRFLLQAGMWEERFGLRVVLNSIDENSLRSIDKWTFDAISRHTRVQSSREAPAREFGLDIEQDLLRAATGTPKDESYGKRLSGMDSLHAVVRTQLRDVPDLLGTYLGKFNDESYRESFPWVDQMSEVSLAATVSRLDDALVARLRNSTLTRCWLAVPELVDWAGISGFRYKFGARDPQHHDLHLPDVLNAFGGREALSVDILKSRYAFAIDLAGERRHRWSIYHCLYCELEHEGETYLLSGSKWYRVRPDFVDAIN